MCGKGLQLPLVGGGLNLSKHLLQSLLRKVSAVHHNDVDSFGVADFFERIGVEQHKISAFPRFDRAE